MISSINHSFGISDKFRKRYGSTWASIDFYPGKLNLELYKTDPMNYVVGDLQIANTKIKIAYRDFNKLEATLIELMANASQIKDKTYTFKVSINGHSFDLKKHEISRVYETIVDAKLTIHRNYEMGV
jgi:hypothetical protein